MRVATLVAVAGTVLALLAGLALPGRSSASDDEAANVRKQCSAFVQAWNKHDAKAMAALFAEEGDMLGEDGKHAAGRAAVQAALAADHASDGPMHGSTLHLVDEPVRFITQDVAVSDAEVTISGMVGPDGSLADASVHVTNVWRKSDGTWWLEASRPYVKEVTAAEEEMR